MNKDDIKICEDLLVVLGRAVFNGQSVKDMYDSVEKLNAFGKMVYKYKQKPAEQEEPGLEEKVKKNERTKRL